MEGQQSSFLDQLLLGRQLSVVSLNRLSQELFLSGSREHLREDRLTLVDVTSSESCKTELHDGSVVEDLSSDIGLGDGVLQMRHEEQISSLVVSTVSGLVEDVGKDGSSSQERRVRVVNVDTEQVNKSGSVPLSAEGSDGGLQTLSRLGDSGFKVVNNDIGLPVSLAAYRETLNSIPWRRCAPIVA